MPSSYSSRKALRTYQNLLNDALDYDFLRLSKPLKGLCVGDLVKINNRVDNMVSLSFIRRIESFQNYVSQETKPAKNIDIKKTNMFNNVRCKLVLKDCKIDQIKTTSIKDIYQHLKNIEKNSYVFVVGSIYYCSSSNFDATRNSEYLVPVSVSEADPDRVTVGVTLINHDKMYLHYSSGVRENNLIINKHNQVDNINTEYMCEQIECDFDNKQKQINFGTPTIDPKNNTDQYSIATGTTQKIDVTIIDNNIYEHTKKEAHNASSTKYIVVEVDEESEEELELAEKEEEPELVEKEEEPELVKKEDKSVVFDVDSLNTKYSSFNMFKFYRNKTINGATKSGKKFIDNKITTDNV